MSRRRGENISQFSSRVLALAKLNTKGLLYVRARYNKLENLNKMLAFEKLAICSIDLGLYV